MKKSAGIIAYRTHNNSYQLFIEHMGGPYWAKKDEGAWSFPKGEYEEELPIKAAIREFREETGVTVEEKDLFFVASIKQSSQKLVTMFACETNFDAEKIISNYFEMEWPPKSGTIQRFPEMDRGAWVSIPEAKRLLLKGQIKFIEKLEMILEKTNTV